MSLFLLEDVRYKNIKYSKIEIEDKKISFICGESGTGKSTLLKLLNGVITADSGKISYLNNLIESYDSIDLRKDAMLVGQTVYLFDKTIRENFYEYYDFRCIDKPSDEEIIKYLKICCIDFSLDSVCTTMSGGERQRVYISICLSMLPKTIMFDEPTSALDEYTSDRLLNNIIEFCKSMDMSVVVISHNKALADRYAEKLIYLSREDN
ncbi:ABC transporter ATP-binding protein [Metaclostridioides mangenotii]|uniref:ABC transporter ATP-binding protein n=1 Tax=Metaclostridioides mangenotii TaxID=1540 RepID=UPI0026F145C4|nr:ATP-binding cassette domain-containing protein [Clostridioides mangenotii]